MLVFLWIGAMKMPSTVECRGMILAFSQVALFLWEPRVTLRSTLGWYEESPSVTGAVVIKQRESVRRGHEPRIGFARALVRGLDDVESVDFVVGL